MKSAREEDVDHAEVGKPSSMASVKTSAKLWLAQMEPNAGEEFVWDKDVAAENHVQKQMKYATGDTVLITVQLWTVQMAKLASTEHVSALDPKI